MDLSKLRAWWAHRQGLDGSLSGHPAADILERTGWARSVGGSGPYLGLFARGGLSREAVDAAVAALEIHELPSARGCTYVLPAADYALGLLAGQGFNGEGKVAAKLGVTAAEIDTLCAAVAAALAAGPLAPEQLKQAVGGAARTLGPEGVKKGLASTMPVALGKLQSEGRIRRIPVDGRLDRQRYRYALWIPAPLAGGALSREETFTQLARRYFRWIGPATLAEFQWFSGLGVKAAMAAAEPLGLVPLEPGSARLLLPADRDLWERFDPPGTPRYSLVSSLDAIILLRRDISLLLDQAGAERTVWTEKGPRPLGGLSDIPSHAILDRGRLAGLWEFDVAANSIVWTSFEKAGSALEDAIGRTEQYVRTQLGDARSFSLDSPQSRAARIAGLRA